MKGEVDPFLKQIAPSILLLICKQKHCIPLGRILPNPLGFPSHPSDTLTTDDFEPLMPVLPITSSLDGCPGCWQFFPAVSGSSCGFSHLPPSKSRISWEPFPNHLPQRTKSTSNYEKGKRGRE